MNIFEVSIALPPREQIQFRLVYQHLMRRRNTKYNHVVVLDPGQIVRDFMAHVTVEESRSLTTFEVPPLRHNVTDDDFSMYGKSVQNQKSIFTTRLTFICDLSFFLNPTIYK